MSGSTASRAEDGRLRAPLFAELAQGLGREQRRVILDLGAASSGTLAFWQGFRCRLLIADIGAELDALGQRSSDPDELAAALDALLPQHWGEPADAVLCWDLLSYCSRPLLGALAAQLARLTRPGALAHVLLPAPGSLIPQQITRCSAIGPGELSIDHLAPRCRVWPQHSAWDLEKYGGNLRVERSVMLRGGMQEYLLRIAAGKTLPREVKAVYRTSAGAPT